VTTVIQFHYRYILAILILLAAACSPASAAPPPIRLHADSIQLDQKKNISDYRGNVRLRQGTFELRADRARARGNSNQPELISAWGRPLTVRDYIDGQKLKLTASKARYNVRKEIIDLTGSVTIKRNNEIVHSARVRYDLKQKRAIAGGAGKDSRVSAVILPRKTDSTKNHTRKPAP
jgi:lipopolysaccharide export system protein LptA